MELKLWEHQAAGVARCKDKDFHMLTMEVGTGKTATLIRIYANKCTKHQKLLPAIIFCPPITLRNWKKEIHMWMDIADHRVIILDGPIKKRGEKIKKSIELFGSEIIFITNYQGIVQKDSSLKDGLKFFASKNENVFLCLDEAHKVKDPSSKTSKNMFHIAQFCKYRFLLTGTPVLNSEMDLFQQFKIMEPNIFGKSVMQFRARYFTNIFANVPHMTFPKYEVKPEMIPELNTILNKYSYRVKKEECLDLPPLVKERYEVAMSTDQKRAYKQMEKEFVAYLHKVEREEPAHAVADLVITKSLRLQQIVSGFLKAEDEEEHLFKKNPRAEALKDLLEEITPNHKVIVWAVFKKNYEIIAKVCQDIGVKYVETHGGIPNNKKFEAVEEFNNGDARVFIGHPGSAGIGINLVVASYSIYYSRTFSLEHDLQSEARNYRGGSEMHESITRIDLVCPGTIDETVLEALEKKLTRAENLTMLKEKYK